MRFKKLLIMFTSLAMLITPPRSVLTVYGGEHQEINGIDVSSWNGNIDWNRVDGAGVEFAILRVHQLYGIDDCFEANYAGCVENDIDVGVYKYSYALTEEQAIEEADAVLEILNGRVLNYPIFYDLEWDTQRSLGRQACTDIALAFLKRIEGKSDYTPAIYSNADWMNNVLYVDQLPYDYWVAAYPTYDTGDIVEHLRPEEGIGWQYSSSGSVDGIPGRVDMDVFYEEEITSYDPNEELDTEAESADTQEKPEVDESAEETEKTEVSEKTEEHENEEAEEASEELVKEPEESEKEAEKAEEEVIESPVTDTKKETSETSMEETVEDAVNDMEEAEAASTEIESEEPAETASAEKEVKAKSKLVPEGKETDSAKSESDKIKDSTVSKELSNRNAGIKQTKTNSQGVKDISETDKTSLLTDEKPMDDTEKTEETDLNSILQSVWKINSNPAVKHVCKICESEIPTGMHYIETEDGKICEDCISNMSAVGLLNALNIRK